MFIFFIAIPRHFPLMILLASALKVCFKKYGGMKVSQPLFTRYVKLITYADLWKADPARINPPPEKII